jgi:hypothetical protein
MNNYKPLHELSKMLGVWDELGKQVEEYKRDYALNHSNCCDADILVGDVCADCKEHCANQLD